MDEIARLSKEDRRAAFTHTAAQMGLPPLLVEKDFWVCWTLGRLFGLERPPRLLFKGGTSLSKCYGLIRRFSEDIDLGLHRDDIGLGAEDDPSTRTSRKGHQKAMKAFTPKVQAYVEASFCPRLRAALQVLDEAIELELEHSGTETAIAVRYPRSLDDSAYGGGARYVSPIVLLEIGARSDHYPTREVRISPYVADQIPEFAGKGCDVVAQAPERTLVEKALLLHTQIAKGAMSRAMSRHAYDTAMLARDAGTMGRVSRSLYEEVARHKFVFADDRHAKDAPTHGISLRPNAEVRALLDADYRQMGEMFFEAPPALDEVLGVLATLEDALNGLKAAPG
jgi:hypothetical protein